MILRLVKMEFEQEKVSEFLIYFEEIQPIVASQKGVLSVKLYKDKHRDNVFFTHSYWLNESALNNYRDSDTFIEIWKKTKSLFSNRAEVWTLELN